VISRRLSARKSKVEEVERAFEKLARGEVSKREGTRTKGIRAANEPASDPARVERASAAIELESAHL
jgi:hypothetical protein